MGFRLGAVMVGLLPFVLAEVTLATLGWGRPDYSEDPFAGFRAVRPLFVLDESGSRYEIVRSRLAFFRPDSFPRRKAPREFRIFCLGGSTVQGRPFAIETSFAAWLQLALETADPTRQWRVVNCGGISYASYRLVPILEEVLAYQPDLVIVYTGHNEFLEDRTYAHVKYMPELLARPYVFLLRTHTYTLLREGYLRLCGEPEPDFAEGRPILETETDAMLEYRGGLEEYHRDEKWRRDVIEHFRYNLRRLVEIARRAGVPLWLMNPACKLRDCPPFKTQHRDGLTPDELKTWESLVARAADCQGKNLVAAVDLLKQAIEIDDQHAGVHYLLATCYDALGETEHARQSYLQAKEQDICPLRILEPMNQAVLDVAQQTDTPMLDVRKLFNQLDEDGIPGGYWLLDHVHPSIPGHQLIGVALAEKLMRQGVVQPVPDWQRKRDARFKERIESLGDLYFAQGIERLERLRCWTQGKADAVRKTKSQ